jgi:CheY-like chemotaxis protein
MLIRNLFKIETVSANNGLQAVEIFEEAFKKECQCANRSFKFIFMDLQMPEMDGY